MFTYGERLVDRVDFEELALKGVDPSMGPKISSPRSPSSEEQKKTVRVCITVGGAGIHYIWTLASELDSARPSRNCWHLAISSPRSDPYETDTTAS